GLEKKPFNPTPDPKFLYLTPSHREALAQILYGVQEGKGFIVLTGEVGTGKTTLIQTLLRRLDEKTEVAYIFNSKLPFDALVEYMLRDFGITENFESLPQRLFALNNVLIERRRAGQKSVLIIDEAQNLDLPELRQLKQRISLRCVIRPLTTEETRDYIQHRLRIAGGRRIDIFSDAALQRITRYAGGIPRLVNIVCDHALLFGYAEQKRRIDQDTIDQVIAYIEQGARPEHPRKNRFGGGWSLVKAPFHWISGALATLLLLAVMFFALRQNGPEDFSLHVENYIVEVLRSVFSMFAMIT